VEFGRSASLHVRRVKNQIQRDALDRNVRVSDLLRRVKLAATKLGLGAVEDWVEQESGKPSVHPLRGDEIRALRELRRQFPDSAFVFATERGG
jgi:AbiTii